MSQVEALETDLNHFDPTVQRNQGILARVNDYLAPVTIDHERDVLPLTPAGHPTERHLVVAYVQAAERTVAGPLAFWADRLDLLLEETALVMAELNPGLSPADMLSKLSWS